MSRTIDELLQETLVHIAAASEYSRFPGADEGMTLDAMTMRLFAKLETLTQLPDAVDAIKRELATG